MTRKDYVAIAASLRAKALTSPGINPSQVALALSHGYATAVEAVADALAGDNPRFDRERFYSAVYDEPQS